MSYESPQLKMGDIPFSIDDAKNKSEPHPRPGRVNEVCREWLVREDGALAYRLQSQEINEHYTGNKHRNAQVREDFPCALDEQIREQHLAEQAAAVYHQMLAEQEEIDNKLAQELAEKLEREEYAKKRAIEFRDAEIARQILEKEKLKQSTPREPKQQSPQKYGVQHVSETHSSPQRPDSSSYYANAPRKGYPMPLPSHKEFHQILKPVSPIKENNDVNLASGDSAELYTQPYRCYENLNEQFDRIEIAEVGLPIDDYVDRQLQEAKDAELARKLQEQESSSEGARMNRDRMLAIEAQDKELAKLLQERERAKVKRARERAKQKALAKKQLQQQQQQNQVMPDDAYSFPADIIQPDTENVNYSEVVNARTSQHHSVETEDEMNYSFPADIVSRHPYPQKNYDARYIPESGLSINTSSSISGYPSFNSDKGNNGERYTPVRPTQLDLKCPINRPAKYKFPEPDLCESVKPTFVQASSPSRLTNIAMAIDPTYTRRGVQSPPSYDTTSSTVTTSTSGSSPGMVLPPPDLSENEGDTSPVPPYMPIQGQRRTASLEKKKKKSKDGCKQQ